MDLEKISWMDKISNEVLAQINEMRTMLNSIWARKHRWTGHVLWHNKLLCNLMEGRFVGKPTRARRRLQALEDLCENNSNKVLKRTAENRSAWRESMRKKVTKTCCTADN